jgi:hypothetical protein
MAEGKALNNNLWCLWAILSNLLITWVSHRLRQPLLWWWLWLHEGFSKQAAALAGSFQMMASP